MAQHFILPQLNLPHLVTFMNILRFHKRKEIDQYINGLIYVYHKHSI